MKRNISDLLDQYRDTAVELECDAPLSSSRIKELTMNKIREKTPRRRRITKILLAAAIIAALTATIFAAENIMTYDNWFEDYFSGKAVTADITENQLRLLEQSVAQVNQSVTSGGYTVTLETAIADSYAAYLTFRIDGSENVVLDGLYYDFAEERTNLIGDEINDGVVSITTGGWKLLDDGDPADNSILLLKQVFLNRPEGRTATLTDGGEKTITLKTIMECKSDASPPEALAQGEWNFRFSFADAGAVSEEIEMLPSSVRCTGRRALIQKDFDVSVKVTSFRLRALTATCVYEKPLTGAWNGILLDPIYVVFKDGSRVKANYKFSGPQEGGTACIFQFDVPVSFQDVDYVEFAGGDRAYMPCGGE